MTKIIKHYGHAINIEVGKQADFQSHSLMEKIGTYTSTATGEVVVLFQSLSRGHFYFTTEDHIEMKVSIDHWLDAHADMLLATAREYRASHGLPEPVSQPPVAPGLDVQAVPPSPVKPYPETPAPKKSAIKPSKCPVCKRYGADSYLTCEYAGCPDGRKLVAPF